MSQSLSRARFSVTQCTAAHQAPLSVGYFRNGYWNGLPFPSPGDHPNPGIEPGSPAVQAHSLLMKLRGKAPIVEVWSSNHWTTREVPAIAFKLIKIILFITDCSVFIAVWAFLSLWIAGVTLVVMLGLLIAVASLVAKHRL